MIPAAAQVLALVRLKEGRSYHAHGQVWRSDRPVEVRDPVLLKRVLADGLLSVTRIAVRATPEVAEPVTPDVGAAPTPHVESTPHAEPTQHAEPTPHAEPESTPHEGSEVTPHGNTPHVGSDTTPHGEPTDTAPSQDEGTPHVRQPSASSWLSEQAVRLLEASRSPRPREDLQAVLDLKDRMHFQNTYLKPLVEAGLLALTNPDNPRSPFQRYQTTERGLALLAKGGEA